MVYVFGINMPMFELLFVVLIIQVVGLALVLYEVRRLRQLLTEEKTVVHHLDEELDRIEEDEGKLSKEALSASVQTALDKGMTKEQIEDVLVKRGVDDKVIKKVL
jgi:hypothetical protein